MQSPLISIAQKKQPLLLRILTSKRSRKYLPFYPLGIFVLLFICAMFTYNILECYVCPAFSDLAEYAKQGMSIAGGGLGGLGLLIYIVKETVSTKERQITIENYVQHDIREYLTAIRGGTNNKTPDTEAANISDFLRYITEGINQEWKSLEQIPRYFRWGNVVLSFAFTMFAVCMYVSYMIKSPNLWGIGFNIFFSAIVCVLIQTPIAIYPAYRNSKLLSELENHESIFKAYTHFSPNSTKAISELSAAAAKLQ